MDKAAHSTPKSRTPNDRKPMMAYDKERSALPANALCYLCRFGTITNRLPQYIMILYFARYQCLDQRLSSKVEGQTLHIRRPV